MGLRFEWDPEKSRRNLSKHGVSIPECSTVFADPLSRTIPDPDHSVSEQRFVTLGVSHRMRILVVVHSEEERDRIRIISARLANQRERRRYEQR